MEERRDGWREEGREKGRKIKEGMNGGRRKKDKRMNE